MVKRTTGALVLMAALAGPAVAQETPLAAARELYASARYDEALAVLNGIRPLDSGNAEEVKSVEQYRSLCLLALGRGQEAEAAIEAVVTVDPAYQPTETDASPRVRAAFAEVRQRLLPDIVRSRYAIAKATYDRKDYATAEAQFRELLRLLDDPEMGGRLSDLRVLATGFIDLSAAAAAPPPEPAKEEPAAPPAPAAPPMATPDHIFNADEPGVEAAVQIKQDVPRVPSQIAGQTRERGLLEVVIDEQGRVVGLKLRASLHPVYDTLLIAAAREWRYRPARYQGRPVKYRKMIQITVKR
jgi:tetratricopeptide (TPR) repeat protein